MRKPKITISITQKFKVRARIKESHRIPIEVTIGSESWRKGKANPWETEVIAKAKKAISVAFGHVLDADKQLDLLK